MEKVTYFFQGVQAALFVKGQSKHLPVSQPGKNCMLKTIIIGRLNAAINAFGYS
jgi:hypothetical protein